jgi:hypothetical protein
MTLGSQKQKQKQKQKQNKNKKQKTKSKKIIFHFMLKPKTIQKQQTLNNVSNSNSTHSQH